MGIPLHDEKLVFDLFVAQIQTRVVEIAVRIGMFEALREPTNKSTLGARLSIGKRATNALVSVLAASGLVSLSSDTIALTGVAREYMLRDSPFFKGGMFHNIPSKELEMLREVHLQDGLVRPITARWNAGIVEAPERQAEHMHAHTFAAASVFAEHPIFDSVTDVLDIAGGVGTFSIALAQRYRAMRCTVLDLPPMAVPAKTLIEKSGVSEQVTIASSDMFKANWKSGYDAVIFSNIFHDWDLPKCKTLAQKALTALRPGGHVFVNEILFDDQKGGPLAAALFSSAMMLVTEGAQFSFQDLNGLLTDAGFVDVEVVKVFGYYSLVTGRKAP